MKTRFIHAHTHIERKRDEGQKFWSNGNGFISSFSEWPLCAKQISQYSYTYSKANLSKDGHKYAHTLIQIMWHLWVDCSAHVIVLMLIYFILFYFAITCQPLYSFYYYVFSFNVQSAPNGFLHCIHFNLYLFFFFSPPSYPSRSTEAWIFQLDHRCYDFSLSTIWMISNNIFHAIFFVYSILHYRLSKIQVYSFKFIHHLLWVGCFIMILQYLIYNVDGCCWSFFLCSGCFVYSIYRMEANELARSLSAKSKWK